MLKRAIIAVTAVLIFGLSFGANAQQQRHKVWKQANIPLYCTAIETWNKFHVKKFKLKQLFVKANTKENLLEVVWIGSDRIITGVIGNDRVCWADVIFAYGNDNVMFFKENLPKEPELKPLSKEPEGKGPKIDG